MSECKDPMSADFTRVPVIDVHKDNLSTHLPGLLAAIDDASFVAIDCELSGLGDRKKLNAASIDERYQNTCLVAKTRSIIALGLSTFTLENINQGDDCEKSNGSSSKDNETNGHSSSEKDPVKSWNYRVCTYNIMMLCGEDYIVEPGALKFLVEHGFDFRKQYSQGIPYLRGNDREDKCEDTNQPLRQIFSHIVKARKALALHNGLIDLIFLYHNLYAALPDKLGTFISDITEMFPQGVYDTKYIADYVSRTHASFLEFVFRKEQRMNREKFQKNRPHVKIRFQNCECTDVDWRYCGSEKELLEGVEVCFNYAHHGHCPSGNQCEKSHDIDHIIRSRNIEKERKTRKRRRPNEGNGVAASTEGNGVAASTEGNVVAASNGDNQEDNDEDITDECDEKEDAENKEEPGNSGGHRAGFDAFMTGFAFTTFLVHQTQIPLNPVDFQPSSLNTESIVNRIYLVSKDFPMLLSKSSFAKSSLEHFNKMKRLKLICDE